MRTAVIRYNFLPKAFYDELKKEIIGLDLTQLTPGRSSIDLNEKDIKTPSLSFFNKNYTNSFSFWRSWSLRLGINIENFHFNADFIEPRNGIGQMDEDFFYGRMDVGFGLHGYGKLNGGKGNHIDNHNRVISGLLYFSDQKDFKGGEFELTDSEGNTDQSINIAENMAIFTVQDKYGWHKVNPVEELKGDMPRIAIYFALSYTKSYWKR